MFLAIEQTNPGCVVIWNLCYIWQTSRYYGSNERSSSWLGCTICLSQDLHASSCKQFYDPFKDKILKNLVCRADLASTERKFNKHIAKIGRINSEALQWLEAIPFQLLTLSNDGDRRYEIMTTNMLEVFNSVIKGALSLSFTALVQLTFFRLNSYFVARREQGANRLASDEQFTPYVDAQI